MPVNLFEIVFSNELVARFVLSCFTVAFSMLAVVVGLRVFRVKNPAVRYFFLIIPLMKGLSALVRAQPQVEPFSGALVVTGQFPNMPQMLPTLPDSYPVPADTSQFIAIVPLLVLAGAALIFVSWRLSNLIRFHRIISQAPELTREKSGLLFDLLDRLTEEAGVRYPRISLVRAKETPFTVGLRRPIIAVSPQALDELSPDELEAMLGHEIAHIQRNDNIWHWPVVLLRDLLFFIPFTYWIYNYISFERERACDEIGSKLSKPLALAKSLVHVAELRQSAESISRTPL